MRERRLPAPHFKAEAEVNPSDSGYFAGVVTLVGFTPVFLACFSGRESGIKYPPPLLTEKLFRISLSPYLANVTAEAVGVVSVESASNNTPCPVATLET